VKLDRKTMKKLKPGDKLKTNNVVYEVVSIDGHELVLLPDYMEHTIYATFQHLRGAEIIKK
jgi:hypothetical protein